MELIELEVDDSNSAQIRQALLETYFKERWVEGHATEAALKEVEEHVYERFSVCRRWLVPWIKRFAAQRNLTIVEIGCGTGSSTAALADSVAHLDAYDIDEVSVEAARRRMDIMGIRNVTLNAFSAGTILKEIQRRHPSQSVECVLLFAVLEHQLYAERIETLRACWEILQPGGLIFIGDTPNRLSLFDGHTSWLPFFDSLPDELAIDYASHSPREDFRRNISRSRTISTDAARLLLARVGRGVSFHEFELALGDMKRFIVGDGFDPEPIGYFGVSIETRILYTYALKKKLRIPPGFLRNTIELVLAKPGPGAPKALRRSPDELARIIRPYVDP